MDMSRFIGLVGIKVEAIATDSEDCWLLKKRALE